MLKILITKKVIESLQCTASFFGCTEEATVPDYFYGYPDQDGNLTLIQVYPVMNVAGVETWAQDNDAEEVKVWSSDEFEDQHMPKNVRWFVDKRPPASEPKSVRRSLLKQE